MYWLIGAITCPVCQRVRGPMAVVVRPRPMFQNVTIENCGVGMQITGGTVTGEGIRFKDNEVSLRTLGDAVVEFDDVTIR